MGARNLSLVAHVAVGLMAGVVAGCVGGSSSSAEAGGTSPPAPDASDAAVAASEDGAALLQARCTVCHDLGGLPAFADYYGEPEWHSLIETMIGYGAEVSAEEQDVLARYLAENY